MNNRKLRIALDLVLIVLLLAAVILLGFTVTTCKKAEIKCEDYIRSHYNQGFLPYTDSFGNPTNIKPLEICKEVK